MPSLQPILNDAEDYASRPTEDTEQEGSYARSRDVPQTPGANRLRGAPTGAGRANCSSPSKGVSGPVGVVVEAPEDMV